MSKKELSIYNNLINLVLTIFLFPSGLTNLIPTYSSDGSWNCPNYKYYKSYEIEGIDGYFEFRNLCRAYFISVSLSLLMFLSFGISSIASWRAHRRL